MQTQFMRVQKTLDDRVIYPVSLTYWEEEVYGKDLVYGDKAIDEHEIYVCVGGEAVAYVGENTYSLRPGTVLTYSPKEQHRTFVTGLAPYRRYVLLFHYEEFSHLWQGVDQAMFSMVSQREDYQDNAISLSPNEFQRLEYLLQRAMEYGKRKQPGDEALFVADFFRIMQLLSQGFINNRAQQNRSNRIPLVNLALELIETHYLTLHRADEIAKRLNVSDSYLSRIFKKQVGVTVYDYLLNMKFSHAVGLLSRGAAVIDACFESGFNSYSHFIQMFKKRYGTTPRKYRTSLDV